MVEFVPYVKEPENGDEKVSLTIKENHMKKFIFYFISTIISIIVTMNLQSCSEKDGDTEKEEQLEFAPLKLPIGYVIAVNKDKYPLYFWIKNSSQGWHNNSRNMGSNTPIFTNYYYEKIDSNTAAFSFSIKQYINGPITKREFNYSGIITFTSQSEFSYSGTYDYYANGIFESTRDFSEPNLTFLSEDKYPVLKTLK